jgi:hypothetical protein
MLFTGELYLHILLGKNYIVDMSLRRCYVAHFAHFAHFAESLNLTGLLGTSRLRVQSNTVSFPDPKPTPREHTPWYRIHKYAFCTIVYCTYTIYTNPINMSMYYSAWGKQEAAAVWKRDARSTCAPARRTSRVSQGRRHTRFLHALPVVLAVGWQ